MARGNNSGNGNNQDYKIAPSSSGKIKAPQSMGSNLKPGKQQGGDLRMNGKKR